MGSMRRGGGGWGRDVERGMGGKHVGVQSEEERGGKGELGDKCERVMKEAESGAGIKG